MEIVVRPVQVADLSHWVTMRHALWPDSKREDLESEAEHLLAECSYRTLVLIAETSLQGICGFAEASLRFEYVNGCDTSPVGFLEGIFVSPEVRRVGVGKQLISEVKNWVKEKGCAELASDSYIDNLASLEFHQATGFVETERTVFFRQSLGSG